MLVSLLLMLSMIATPVATPIGLAFPEWITPLGAPGVGRPNLSVPGVAYIAAEDGVVSALDTEDGSALWRSVVMEPPAAGVSVHEGQVYVPGSRGTLQVLDAGDGGQVSATSLSSTGLTTPLVHANILVTADEDGTIFFLDRTTLEMESFVILGGAPVEDGVLVGDLAIFAAEDNTVIATDVVTGDIAWQAVVPAPVSTYVADEGGDLYIGTGNGLLGRIAVDDGSVLWQQVLEAKPVHDLAFSPYGLLVTVEGGDLRLLDADDGRTLWHRIMPGTAVIATEQCGDQCFLAATPDSLIAVATATGEWRTIAVAPGPLAGDTEPVQISIAATNDIVVAQTYDGDVVLWRLAGGQD